MIVKELRVCEGPGCLQAARPGKSRATGKPIKYCGDRCRIRVADAARRDRNRANYGFSGWRRGQPVATRACQIRSCPSTKHRATHPHCDGRRS